MKYKIEWQNIFGFSRFVTVLQTNVLFSRMLMTVTFAKLDVYSCLSFNKLIDNLNGKADRIYSISFKYAIHANLNWVLFLQ